MFIKIFVFYFYILNKCVKIFIVDRCYMKLKIGSYNICHCGDYTNRKETDPVWIYDINLPAMARAIKQLDFDIR